MAVSLGPGSGKTYNVELNIVPFIDLMSCLTAFLLVTAVWSNIAQLQIEPQGRRQGGEGVERPVVGSVLIQRDTIWLGLSRVDELYPIARVDAAHDWAALEATLREHRATTLADARSVEIAGEDDVPYQDLVAAMDVALRAGFPRVGLADPAGLSMRPTR